MKVAYIVPDGMISSAKDTGYYLTLPWNIDMYEDKIGFKILDNGAAERYELDIDEYIELMHKHSPNEIVLPDVLRDYTSTARATERFLADRSAELPQGLSMMGVAQGKDWSQFKLAALDYARTEAVTCLGVPKHMVNTLDDRWARVDFIQWILSEGLEEEFPMGIHCLGGTDWVREVRVLSELPNVRGIDTSVPAILSMLHKDIEEADTRPERPDNFFDYQPTLEDVGFMILNQDVYTRWANGSV